MTVADLTSYHSFAARERRIAALIECRLATLRSGDFPRFAGATASMLKECTEDADYVIEIALRVTMLADLFPTIGDHQVAGNESRVANRVCDYAMRASYVAADLAPRFQSMAKSAQLLVENGERRGLPVKLVSVHLAQFGFWEQPDDAQFVVTIETLGQNLRSRHMPMTTGSEEALGRLFVTAMETLERRAVARARLDDANADGTIDLLSLNAIARVGNAMAILQTMMTRNDLTLGNDFELCWEEGAIYSIADGTDRVAWTGSILTVSDYVLPETTCINAIGRPVTDVIAHPALDERILVGTVTSHEGEGANFVIACLEIPDLYFNVESGQIWSA
ncbi:hypothetical protein FSB78_10485 [Sphingomonas ginsenosidivorax]|uniref:Uncharacterized protein n=1 Tax=Sphingomonas ginsenosidivorax TaxID=862135 RepID=A0A5C6UGG6_9SPHN|nr:hypothetical protein [Sphingomonas ginsenosidivorax]TXC71321.1 hypothetical protein FSB78_10485 [Sphingomonas ginsenosidivorax]